MMRTRGIGRVRRAAVAALVGGAAWLASAGAQAQLRVVEGAPAGVAELAVGQGGLTALVRVKNEGPKPAQARVRTLSGDDDMRTPRAVTATFEGRADQATIAPGETQAIRVRWQPSQSPRLREVYGQVAVEAGGERALFGVHGELAGAIAPRALGLLALLPLLGAVAAWAARLAGRAAQARPAALAGAGGHLALAAWLLLSFDRAMGRSDGNEGLQFIERQGLGPVEWFVGLDGGSALAVAAVAAGGLASALSSASPAALALGSLAACGLTVAAVAQDLALLWVALTVGLGALLARALAAGAPRRLAALPAATLGLSGAAFVALSGAARAPSGRSFALPDLVRSDLLSASLLGQPIAASALVLLVAALGPWLPLWPLGGGLRGLRERGGAVAAALPAVATVALARLAALALPEGLAWAGPGLAWLGAAAAVVAGLGALGGEPGRVAGPLLAVQAGLGLVGLGAGTPQGLAGAAMGGVGASLGWLLASWPAGASAWTRRVGLLALAGVPGLVGFWGPTLALTGAMPQRTGAALLALLGWLLGLVAAARAVHAEGTPTVVTPDAPGARDARLALAAVVVALGLAPGLVTGPLERWALDLGSFVSAPGPAQVAQR